jgi:UDP:flavonoid glycosyltransferase YjiC (YdhE family)
MGKPDNVFMLGNCPHDWLFQHVSCVVHHGGAGTMSAGIALGRPTVIVVGPTLSKDHTAGFFFVFEDIC